MSQFHGKRRWISCLLLLTILLELFPAALPDGLRQHVYASEPAYVDAAPPYTVDAPLETVADFTAEIPPVIIEGESTQQSSIPVLSENGSRYAALLNGGASFSALAQADRQFLCEYTGVSESAYLTLEQAGIALQPSVKFGRLAAEYGCDAAEIAQLNPSDAQYADLLAQLAVYRGLLRQELFGTALDKELRGFLLRGYSCEQVLYAYAIGCVLEENPELLLKSNAALTQAVPDDRSAAVRQKLAEITAMPQSAGADSDDAPSTALWDACPGSPYTYTMDEQERTALNSGALILETEDYVLPGIAGLDLVIGRRYNAQEALPELPGARTQLNEEYAYYVFHGALARCEISTGGGGSWPEYDESYTVGPFATYAEAEAYAEDCPTGSVRVPDFGGEGVDLVLEYYVEIAYKFAGYSGYTYSTTYPNEHDTRLYGLGHGWNLRFSSLDTAEQRLYLSDGSSYRTDFSVSGSHLKDHPLTDLVLDRNCTEFSNGEESSWYRLTWQNGRREYFDYTGRLIGIQDRYENTITLIHANRSKYPHITITDTLGRQIVISGQDTENGHCMLVALPDGNTLRYQVEHDGSAWALASYTDAGGRITHYSYTRQRAGFDALSKSTSSSEYAYLNLTTVTHPTMAQSVYTYAPVERNLGADGLMVVYRIASRADRIGSDTVNQRTYSYSENDCSGYPQHSNPNRLPDGFSYTAAVNTADRTETVFRFDNRHLSTETTVRTGNRPLQTIETVYHENRLPIRKTTRTYNLWDFSLQMVATVATEYDARGNCIAEWSAQAEGDTGNTEHRTTFTYDDAYGLLLSKTWKTDADTTVQLRNTLDASGKHVLRTETCVNQALTARTDYSYDSFGNVISEKRYHDGWTTYEQTEYAYQDNAYLSLEKHLGVQQLDGTPAQATPGYPDGVIAVRHTYDALGRLTGTVDARGYTTGFQYDALGNITKITHPDGSTVVYSRDYVNNAVTVTNETETQLKYVYTPLGLESAVVDVQTGRILQQKRYNAHSELIRNTDYVYGADAAYTYDFSGNLSSETIYQGLTVLSRTQYTYQEAAGGGQYRQITKTVCGDENAPSVVTTQRIDRNGYVIGTGRILDGTEYLDTFSYDYAGNRISCQTAADRSNGLPFTARYAYNENGQVTQAWNADNQYTTNSYDALGRLTSGTDYAGTPDYYTYDALGRLLTRSTQTEDGSGTQLRYGYDAAGNVIWEQQSIGLTGDTPQWSKTAYEYDCRGRLTRVVRYDGARAAEETSYGYDAAGNLLSVNENGHITRYTYDRFGNVLTVTNPLGQTETHVYSELGKPLSQTDRNGRVISCVRDALGRPVSVTAGTDEQAETVRYAYTLSGQLRSEENGWQKTVYTYDGMGRLIRAEDILQQQLPQAPVDLYTVTLDACGGQVAPSEIAAEEGGVYTLPDPVRTGYVFDGWYLGDTRISTGDPVLLTDDCVFSAHWIKSAHTIFLDPGEGEVTPNVIETADDSYTLPTPVRTGYTFAGWYLDGVRIPQDGSAQLPESCTLTARWKPTSYSVIFYGNGGTSGKRSSLAQFYEYDADVVLSDLGFTRLGCTHIGWTTAAPPKHGTIYPNGTVLRNLAQAGITALYALWDDPNGEVILPIEPPDPEPDIMRLGEDDTDAESSGAERLCVRSYTYDLADNRTSFTLTVNGAAVQQAGYAYDSLNRLTAVTENGVVQASYTYDCNGNRASLTYANGVQERYVYNQANWLVSLENRLDGEILSAYTCTYDAAGNRLTETDHTGRTVSYAYDALGRLTRESDGQQTAQYLYDASGNRLQMTVAGTESYSVAYVYDAANRLLSETRSENGQSLATLYTYDANGNTLSRYTPAHDGERAVLYAYTYDAFNRLSTMTSGRLHAAYAYNAQGIRIEKRVEDVRTAYLTDGGNVAAELTDGIVSQVYLRGTNLISRTAGEERSYYLFNAHGDVTGLTGSGGAVTKTYRYDAFGTELNADPADSNPYRYCGEYFDQESGTYYLRARYYAPAEGRFTQEDTHWNASNRVYGDQPQKRADDGGYMPQLSAVLQSGNLYVYGINNPVMYADSTGESIILTSVIIGAAVGAVLGGGIAAATTYAQLGYVDWKWVAVGAGAGGIVGGLCGWGVGSAIRATVAKSWLTYKAAHVATTSNEIGKVFEEWFYETHKVADSQLSYEKCRFDAIYKKMIVELKNYNWSNYSSYTSQINRFTQQAKKYARFIGKEFAGQKIKKIEFVFSTKPPEKILKKLKDLKELNVIVTWISER